jgi:hypothetical protein
VLIAKWTVFSGRESLDESGRSGLSDSPDSGGWH